MCCRRERARPIAAASRAPRVQTWIDQKRVRVVFVASDGDFVKQARGAHSAAAAPACVRRSATPRARAAVLSKDSRFEEVTILGLSEAEATEFLEKKELWKAAHETPLLEVIRLVGDRFDQLETIAREVIVKPVGVDGAAAVEGAAAVSASWRCGPPAVLLCSTADGRAG
jgi:hypothetical protein